MKKKIFLICIVLAFFMVMLLQSYTFAETKTHTLGEIVEKFNNSNAVKSYKEYGELIATIDEEKSNVISITLAKDEEKLIFNYELEGSILSCEFSETEIMQAFITSMLADSIGQLNGYEDGELYDTLNSEEILNYTVENEGFEIKKNEGKYSIKIDINKKIPLVDFSDFYLKPEEFENTKRLIESGEFGNETGKTLKMSYNLILSEDENYIYMGEENETTESTYNSILSAIEVMYGDEVVEYFKSICPEISDVDYFNEGFTIETDVELAPEEYSIFEGSKVVLVTIDNQYIKDKFFRTEYIGETVNRGDKTITLDFTANDSYKLGFLDTVSSSDAGFLYKYILETVFMESGKELEGNTVYFNIDNGKIVVGDENNSIFKLVIEDDYLEMLPTKTGEKTTLTAKHNNVKSIEYEEGATSADHFRYGEYNVTVNITYGNEVKEEATNEYKVSERADETLNTFDDKKINTVTNSETKTMSKDNPKTGDNIIFFVILFVVSLVGFTGVIIYKKRKGDFNHEK